MNPIRLLIKYLNENFLFTKIENTKDISDPIVDEIRNKKIPKEISVNNTNQITEPLTQEIQSVKKAIEDKPVIDEFSLKNPETITQDLKSGLSEIVSTIKDEFSKMEKEIIVQPEAPNVNVSVDTDSVVESLKKIESKITKAKEPNDYTRLLAETIVVLRDIKKQTKPSDFTKLEKLLSEIKDNSFPKDLIKKGRLKVSLDEGLPKFFSSGGGVGMIVNKQDKQINPATEDTLQSIAGFNLSKYDKITATYPDTATEVYTYSLSGTTVGTITVVYSDAGTKNIISTVTKT